MPCKEPRKKENKTCSSCRECSLEKVAVPQTQVSTSLSSSKSRKCLKAKKQPSDDRHIHTWRRMKVFFIAEDDNAVQIRVHKVD